MVARLRATPLGGQMTPAEHRALAWGLVGLLRWTGWRFDNRPLLQIERKDAA